MGHRSVTVPALSALPGLLHGFGRRGGAGSETREETVARVRSALEGRGRLFLMRQVHGCTVERVPWPRPPRADAAVGSQPGLVIGIATADCLPVLLVDPDQRHVAAVHAGWRGTAAQISRRTVEAIASLGSPPARLLAALGPGIGPCCYEVGEEVRTAFGPAGDAFFRPGAHGRDHLDVRAANVWQLEAAGIRPERIHHVADCTSCRGERYYSYRRDGPGAGRMISHIGYEAP